MGTIPQVAAAMQRVLTEVAEAAGRTSGFVQRASKISGAVFVQTLVFSWLADAEATVADFAQTAALLGVPVSGQALDQRFGERSACCLRQVLDAAVLTVIAGEAAAVPLLARFAAVVLQDSTTVGLPAELADLWPGSGQQPGQPAPAALKTQVQWDLRDGALRGLTLQPGRAHDATSPHQQTELPPQSLRVHDTGYCRLDVLARYAQAQVWTLCRLPLQAVVLSPDGERLDVPALLAAAGAPTLDHPVLLGVTQQLPVRLLGVRVRQEVADQRRRRLYAEARRRGQPVSARALALADWSLYITTAPAALLTLAEAVVLLRARWQIELLFKLWQSFGRLDESRSAKPWRRLTEVYAKLLVHLIQHWAMLVGCWGCPHRSLLKAAKVVRKAAWWLAASVADPATTAATLTRLVAPLARASTMNTRRAHPNTAQRLLAPTTGGVA